MCKIYAKYDRLNFHIPDYKIQITDHTWMIQIIKQILILYNDNLSKYKTCLALREKVIAP